MMERQNKKIFQKEENLKGVPQSNNYSQFLKTLNSPDKLNKISSVVRYRESDQEASSSAVSANTMSDISVNPMNIFKKLREEFTKDAPSNTAVHRLPVQPAPYKRVAQQAPRQDKTAPPTTLRNPRDVAPNDYPPTEGNRSPEHLTIMCFVNGVNVTVDEARTLLNSYISPPTLVTEKSTIVYTKEQLEQFYAHCSSFHMQILEISTNNKRNLLKELEARKSNKHIIDHPSPSASSPDPSRRLIIDEAVVPTSSTAHTSVPDDPLALRSPHLSSRKSYSPEPTGYCFKSVANTNSNTSDLAAKKIHNNGSPNSPLNTSAQTYRTPPSKPVKRTVTYESKQIPPRRVPLPEYISSNYAGPCKRERLIHRVEENRPGGLPVYENITPPLGQCGPHGADYIENGMNYDERQQFYGPRNPIWRDHRLSSPQHQEMVHPMPPSPYFMQRPRFIQPSVEMRQTYAVQNPQEGWCIPSIITNNEEGVCNYYNRAEPISSAQMNLLAKQNLHFQRELRHPGDPYFPI